MKSIDQIIKHSEDLFTSEERANVEAKWSEVAELELNSQWTFDNHSTNDINSMTTPGGRGGKKTKNVYASVGLQAPRNLASAIVGLLMNPATIWSDIKYSQDALNEEEELIRWISECNTRVHHALSESNFANEAPKAVLSNVVLGSLALYEEQVDSTDGTFKGLQFTALHLGQVSWSENKLGKVDTVFRKFNVTARQAAELWPDSRSEEMVKALAKEPEREFVVLHCVYPREEKEIKINDLGLASPEHRPIASLYIDLAHRDLLEETGYYEMPIFVSRWEVGPGERYGRGPGELALPDLKTLTKLLKLDLEAKTLQVHPAWETTERNIIGQLDLRPGQLTTVRRKGALTPIVSGARAEIMQITEERLTQSIEKTFFLDKIQPLANLEKKERMSQLEVMKRLEEMSIVLGPTVSRLNTELLQPLIIRTFRILLRAGKLPPLPQKIQEQGLNVEIIFVNQLARAQQIQELTAFQELLRLVMEVGQFKPEVWDNIDVDAGIRTAARKLGVSEEVISGIDTMKDVREQRAQQQQQMQAMEMLKVGADAASKVQGIPGIEGQ